MTFVNKSFLLSNFLHIMESLPKEIAAKVQNMSPEEKEALHSEQKEK